MPLLRSSVALEALRRLLQPKQAPSILPYFSTTHFHSQPAGPLPFLQNGASEGGVHGVKPFFAGGKFFMREIGQKADKTQIKQYVRNEDIPCPEMRVVFPDGEHKIMTREDALKYVMDMKLDLVLVSTDSIPPVAKIVEFAKFQHSRQQNERRIASATRSREKLKEPKEVRVRPRISDHDLKQKLKKVTEFLTKGHRVTVAVMYKGGQELQMAKEALTYIVKLVEESHQVVVETAPVNAGRRSSVAALMSLKVGSGAKDESAKAPDPPPPGGPPAPEVAQLPQAPPPLQDNIPINPTPHPVPVPVPG